MAQIENTVFISYRRKDISWALAVYQYLKNQNYDVFFDFSSLSSGDFAQVIISNIKARAHFVLILTPTALDRCNEPGDWLRREIEIAVDEKRNVIPLFFDGFNFGSPSVAEKLTGKLAAINRYNGLDIPSGYFVEAMERLSERYLNVPLDAVLHPVPTEVRKVVKEEQVAADKALIQKRADIEELIKPVEEKINEVKQGWNKQTNLRRYGIGAGILAVVLLGIFGVSSLIQSFGNETPMPTLTSQSVLPVSTTLVSPTQTQLLPTSTETSVPPTATPTSTPTLGVGSTLVSTKDGMTLLYVPAGTFTMGVDNDENDNPAHVVNLDAFWIDRTEVTNAMYAKCDDEEVCDPPRLTRSTTRPSYYRNPDFDNFPVIHVSWVDAKTYCEWAERRLPTEAEWEKAARGDDGRIYPWGNDASTIDLSNYGGLIGDTTEVSGYSEVDSPFGALNLAGNVWEWVADYYDSAYYKKSPRANPPGPVIAENRVMRGGSWKDFETTIRAAHRYGNYPLDTASFIGFRCAMDASE